MISKEIDSEIFDRPHSVHELINERAPNETKTAPNQEGLLISSDSSVSASDSDNVCQLLWMGFPSTKPQI